MSSESGNYWFRQNFGIGYEDIRVVRFDTLEEAQEEAERLSWYDGNCSEIYHDEVDFFGEEESKLVMSISHERDSWGTPHPIVYVPDESGNLVDTRENKFFFSKVGEDLEDTFLRPYDTYEEARAAMIDYWENECLYPDGAEWIWLYSGFDYLEALFDREELEALRLPYSG